MFLFQRGSCAFGEVTIPLIMLAAGWMEAVVAQSRNRFTVPAQPRGDIFGAPGEPVAAVSMVEDLPQISAVTGEDAWTVPRKVMDVKFL